MAYNKLHDLSYDTMLEELEPGVVTTIANLTRARFNIATGIIEVAHHGHIVAEIMPDSLSFDNHGYHSRATAVRLDQILQDNGYTERVRIRNGRMTLIDGHDGKVIHRGFRTVDVWRSEHALRIETAA